ncbi:hypothetical protein POM88_053430 [Heracleum sosnowskyi]|uniref:Subtilisin-like protease n=1 Tax=Heracleum sosnowskyi TaxID=360622 RepID=A0AAD8GPZ4_9APIA|nr:hypothetical protein POM88_053430 [Heracleum sosnowskyi]
MDHGCRQQHQVIETALSINSSGSIPKSDVNREFFAEEHDRRARAGLDYESSYEKVFPDDTILKLQRTTPFYKRNMPPHEGHEMHVGGELSQQNIKDRFYGVNDPVTMKLLNKGDLEPLDAQRRGTLYVLVGARYFNKGYVAIVGSLDPSYNSPRDTDGHGSHTLSTTGGSFVPGANVFCYGNGTTKGGSPKARVAAYKVCWPPMGDNACFDADILAAFDVAIDDGIDILSVSLGGDAVDFFIDSVAIGSFHAVKHGILVVCSAGNSGPNAGTAENLSPWKFTVGASTIDRQFPSYVTLGNKIQFKGGSLSVEGLPTKKFYPVIGSKDAKDADASKEDAELYKAKSLDSDKVKGKIMVCLRGDNARVDKGQQALSAGAVAMILANNDLSGNEIIADPHVLPVSHITYSDGLAVYQ